MTSSPKPSIWRQQLARWQGGQQHWHRRHIPIAVKLAIILTLLISSGMLLLGLAIITNQTTILRSQIHDFGQAVVSQLAESSKELLLSDDILSLMVVTSNLGSNSGILGVVIYSDKGLPIASSGILPENDVIKLYHSTDTKNGETATLEWQQATDAGATTEVISFVAPIQFQDLVVGHAVVTFSKELLDKSLTQTIQTIIGVTLFMIVLGIITAYFLGRRLSRPIHRLMHASQAIHEGNYDYRIQEQRNDEIGYLIGAFNKMANGLLEKSQVENAFSRFVSPNVAQQIMQNLDQIKLGGERMDATALFADIAGFTSMSEKMTAEDIATLLNEYFGYIADASRLYSGTIDKYMGDCAMIIFGAPIEDPHHKLNAVCCAILIQRLIKRLNIVREKQGKITIDFRIGINSGEMLAGNMGSHDRMQYTVV
ncbi:MAG: adenylate/guanylate cyclase domain-containing protein, partial [Gammaproteobacteria bacterium]